jgi:hypothetical protein
MGTISKTLPQRMERFWQKQMERDELTQPGWRHTAAYFRESDRKYDTTELTVLAVFKLHTDNDAANLAHSTFGELMESLDIIPGISRMPEGTS